MWIQYSYLASYVEIDDISRELLHEQELPALIETAGLQPVYVDPAGQK